MIKIFDNVVSNEENLYIHQHLLQSKEYWYGEVDTFEHPPTGMVHNINDSHLLTGLKEIIFNYNKELCEKEIQRSYINLFLPGENPFFHADGEVITCLFYFNPEYDINEGGETQFFVEDSLIAVQCKPARLVIFNGKLLHRATSFRSKPRITVAIKFKV